MFSSGLNERFGQDLDSEIDHTISVVRKNNVYEVLADIVDIAFHGREYHASAHARLGLLHELLEVRDGGFHCLRGLQHLGDYQLVVVEQTSDLVHSAHQRTVDYLERRRFIKLEIEIGNQAVLCSLDYIVGQSFIERKVARALAGSGRCAAEVRGESRDGIVAPVPQ